VEIATSTLSPASSIKHRDARREDCVGLGRPAWFASPLGWFSMAFENLLAVAVGHFADFDRFVGVFLPDVRANEIEVARRQQMALGFVGGFDRHVEKAGELFVRFCSAPFDDGRRNAIRSPGKLASQMCVAGTREAAGHFVNLDREGVSALPSANVFEVLHAPIVVSRLFAHVTVSVRV